MLDAAAENPMLSAVVSEGAGERSVNEGLTRGWKNALMIPQQLIMTAAVTTFSGHTAPSSLTSVAKRIAPRAAFFVYAERGVGGEELNTAYYRNAREPKAIWRVPSAGHTGGISAAPREYERRVVGFLLAHLAVRTRRS